jgi:tetratricopeptide (TPR) repeat protein
MKIAIRVAFIFLVFYAVGMSLLYLDTNNKTKKLTDLLEESVNLKKKLQEDISNLSSSKSALEKESEEQKRASLDYLKKQKESDDNLERLKTEIEKRIRKISELEEGLNQAKKKLAELEKENKRLTQISEFTGNVQVKKQEEHIAHLEADLSNARQRMQKQEALLHYNLGVSYMKEKYYDMAIDEYQKALELNPNDPDIHYNLAILYDDCSRNPKRAIQHYQKYLELRPDAADIDEVKGWIADLMIEEAKIKDIETQKPLTTADTLPAERIKGLFIKKVEEIPKRDKQEN